MLQWFEFFVLVFIQDDVILSNPKELASLLFLFIVYLNHFRRFRAFKRGGPLGLTFEVIMYFGCHLNTDINMHYAVSCNSLVHEVTAKSHFVYYLAVIHLLWLLLWRPSWKPYWNFDILLVIQIIHHRRTCLDGHLGCHLVTMFIRKCSIAVAIFVRIKELTIPVCHYSVASFSLRTSRTPVFDLLKVWQGVRLKY